MNISEAIENRKSVRAFTEQAVSRETLEAIFKTSRWSASGTNAQPWEVVVLTGDRKDQLTRELQSAFEQGEKGKMEYNYYPVEWKEPFRSRRIECGKALYNALDIGRDDTQRRRQQWMANYRGFDAPVMVFFFIDRMMEKGSYLDYGMFLQSVMLAAMDHGLTTCPQAALGEYPEIVKRLLGYDEQHVLVCGMAMGYEDTENPVNQYRTVREPVSEFVRFI